MRFISTKFRINAGVAVVASFALLGLAGPVSVEAAQRVADYPTVTTLGSFSDYFSCELNPGAFWCPH